MANVVRTLRNLYFGLAERTASVDKRTRAVHEEECQAMMDADVLPRDDDRETLGLAEAIPLGWRCVENPCTVLPWSFSSSLMQLLLEQEDQFEIPFRVSWLELTVVFLGVQGICFPVSCPTTGKWIEAGMTRLPRPRLTLATQLSVVRQAMRAILRRFDLLHLLHERISLVTLGIGRYVDGMSVCIDPELLKTARDSLIAFSAGRDMSKAASLARPFV